MTDKQLDDIVQLRQLVELLGNLDSLILSHKGRSYMLHAPSLGALKYGLGYLVYSSVPLSDD